MPCQEVDTPRFHAGERNKESQDPFWLWSPRFQREEPKLACLEILFLHSPAIREREQEWDGGVDQLTPLWFAMLSKGMAMDLVLSLLELLRRPHVWSALFMHGSYQRVYIAKRAGMGSLELPISLRDMRLPLLTRSACSVTIQVLHSHETP